MVDGDLDRRKGESLPLYSDEAEHRRSVAPPVARRLRHAEDGAVMALEALWTTKLGT